VTDRQTDRQTKWPLVTAWTNVVRCALKSAAGVVICPKLALTTL